MKLKAIKRCTDLDSGKTLLWENTTYEGECVLENGYLGFRVLSDENNQECFYPAEYFEAPEQNFAAEESSNKIDPNGKVWLAYGDKQVSNLTVRGIFAAIAMLGQSDNDESPESIADTSVKIADALIDRLNRDVE